MHFVRVRALGPTRPTLRGRRAEKREEARELLIIVCALEKRRAIEKLGEAAAERPNVDRRRVADGAENELWRSIEAS